MKCDRQSGAQASRDRSSHLPRPPMPDNLDRFPPTVSPDCYIAIGNRQSQLGNYYLSALAAFPPYWG